LAFTDFYSLFFVMTVFGKTIFVTLTVR